MAQRTFLRQLKDLEDRVKEVQPRILEKAAYFLVDPQYSPDDTGAYILSHSIGRSGNVGRGISSHGRVSARDTHRESALSGLLSQVANIPNTSTRVWIGNNSPHVNAVEFGEPGRWKRSGYFVYTNLRSRFPSMVAKAISELRLK
jgi:hypothetical protein